MKNKAFLISLLFCFIFSSVNAGKWTVETLPDPKDSPSKNFISNPDGIISEEAEQIINSVCLELESKLNIQFGVCAVYSIGDAVPKEFASSLFNFWGIGDQQKQNGLLLLIVLDQKRWEFETGYGLESDLTDVELKRIGTELLVPEFKNENYSTGIVNAVYGVRDELFQENHLKINSENNADFDLKNKSTNYEEGNRYRYMKYNWFYLQFFFGWFAIPAFAFFALWTYIALSKKQKSERFINKPKLILLVFAAILPVLSLFLYGVFPFFHPDYLGLYCILVIYFALSFLIFDYRIRLNREAYIKGERDAYLFYSELRKSNEGVIIFCLVLFPWFFIPYYIWYRKKCSALRKQSRNCSSCNSLMTFKDNVISETDDDRFLNKGQLKEEYIKSQDWDVWLCTSCNATKILGYKSFFTFYQNCPSCKFVTEKYVRSVTIVPATYSSSGTGKKIYECVNCGTSREVTYTIPMKTRSSSSSSGGSSWGGGGSSWGGGRSGGGGAGGSW